jgi:hypothetical protein
MIEFTVAVVGCTPVGPLSNHWFLRESKHKGATRVLATREAKREKERKARHGTRKKRGSAPGKWEYPPGTGPHDPFGRA